MYTPAQRGGSVMAAATILTVLTPGAAAAQDRERAWSAKAQVQGEFRYDDNPFLLTSGQRRRLDQVSAADSQSGRFRDMASPTDVIAAPSVGLAVSGPGLFRRSVALEAQATLEANVQNDSRRHAELSFDVRQSVSKAGRLRVGADWRPGYFHKNYLADGVDVNADGDIGRGERRYVAGTSDEVEISLGYRHRLAKAKNTRPFGLTGELEAAYVRREYDAPFAGRSRKGPGATAGLTADLGTRWAAGLAYAYAREEATPTREVLILNENDFGRDFNGNGSFSDDSARAFELVDRSRNEQSFAVSLRGTLSEAVAVEVAYERRIRDFTSNGPYDIANRDRRDTRNTASSELAVRLAHGLQLSLGGELAAQNTNRGGDPGASGDVSDYRRLVGYTALRFRF